MKTLAPKSGKSRDVSSDVMEVTAISSSSSRVTWPEDVDETSISMGDVLQRIYIALTPAASGPFTPTEPLVVVPSSSSAAERLAHLKDATGLTWDQVARLFGVSKRAVLHWNSGATMSAGHEERLTLLLSRLREAPVDGSEQLHEWLMTIDDSGTAPLQRWVDELLADRGQPRAWIDRQPRSIQ